MLSNTKIIDKRDLKLRSTANRSFEVPTTTCLSHLKLSSISRVVSRGYFFSHCDIYAARSNITVYWVWYVVSDYLIVTNSSKSMSRVSLCLCIVMLVGWSNISERLTLLSALRSNFPKESRFLAFQPIVHLFRTSFLVLRISQAPSATCYIDFIANRSTSVSFFPSVW